MSRNFELLRRLGKQHGACGVPVAAMPYPCGGSHELELDKLSREEITKLVQRVFLSPNNGHERCTVLFAGVESGDGSSRICAYGGQTLAAQVTESVCIVDANLRSPSLHKLFGATNSFGLAEVLAQAGPIEKLPKPLGGANLCLVPAGSAPPGLMTPSSELLRVLGQLQDQFDYLLINGAPVSSYADAVVLGKITDGVILVVEAHATRRETARQAQQSLAAAKVRLLGAVLNQRTFPIPDVVYRRL